MLLSTCRLQGEFLGSGIDRTRKADSASSHQHPVWVQFGGLVTRPRFIDLRQRRSSHAAIPECSRDFQSNPLVAAWGGTRALRIY